MGKRSSFKRRPQDAYDTPEGAVLPLLPYLPRERRRFAELCAGAGDLEGLLRHAGWVCHFACDIKPRHRYIATRDALDVEADELWACDFIITNPPWTRAILHPMILHFSDLRPTWLLFDADWMHTKQAIPYMERCRKIVSVGRVKWIPDSPHTGKDNACWYLFDNTGAYPATGIGPVFIGRKEKAPGQFDDSPGGPRRVEFVTITKQSPNVNVSSTVSASRRPKAEKTRAGNAYPLHPATRRV